MIALLKRNLSSVFTVLVVLFLLYVVVSAADWATRTRLFPWTIAIPALALAIIQLMTEVVRSARTRAEPDDDGLDIVDIAINRDIPFQEVLKRSGVTAAWIAAYFVAVVLVGFVVASPTFVLLYLILRARERWWVIAIATGFVLVLQIGLFHVVLGRRWLTAVFPELERWVLGFF